MVGYRLRHGHGEDSICWDESRKRHIGAIDLGSSPAGRHIRKNVSGKTKVEVGDKLRELHKETDAGLRPRRRYTVGDALEDWLAHSVDGLSIRTVTLYRGTIVKALNEELGKIRLTELTASNVQGASAASASWYHRQARSARHTNTATSPRSNPVSLTGGGWPGGWRGRSPGRAGGCRPDARRGLAGRVIGRSRAGW